MAKTIEGLFYSESHEWVKVDGETAIIGISDHAQQAMGNIVYVDMPEEEDEVTANEDFGAVESVKAASDLISPVSGVVVEVNKALADAPELLNKDAYENWIIKVKMDDPEELKTLWTLPLTRNSARTRNTKTCGYGIFLFSAYCCRHRRDAEAHRR